jgi:hypothetical protein
VLQLSEQQIQCLDSLRSSVVFRLKVMPIMAQPGERSDSHGYLLDAEGKRVYEEKASCQLVDSLTARYWIGGQGATESEALDNALARALSNPGTQPRTPAELHEENQRLRAKLAEQAGPAAAASDTAQAATATAGEQSQPGEQAGGDQLPDLSSMNNSELAQAIQSRGGEVPAGDKRSNAWREQAEDTLRNLERQ